MQAKLRKFQAKLASWQADKLAAFDIAEVAGAAGTEAGGRAEYEASLTATVEEKVQAARAKLFAKNAKAAAKAAAAEVLDHPEEYPEDYVEECRTPARVREVAPSPPPAIHADQ